MATQTSTKSPTSLRQERPAPELEDHIRRRAYELYEQRGREDGRDMEDWLRAEEEIKRRRTRSFAA